MNTLTTYHIFAICINCGSQPDKQNGIIDKIPMGKEWKEYLITSNYKCEHCGCVGTMKRT
jgi:hypothetical protein